VEGTVLNALTGQPVRKAHITLTLDQGGDPVLGVTDAHGRFALSDLSPGAYNLTAGRDGYMGQHYGAKRPGEEQKGELLELTVGTVKSGIDLRLTPFGAIMGFVRDEDGDPVRQVDVSVLAYGYSPSGKGLQVRGQGQTDALGEYRVFDLPPGTYYLRAKPQSAGSPGLDQMTDAYATVYYPNAQQQAGAGTIALAAGQEMRGMDFVLHPVAVAFVRGRIVKPEGGKRCTTNLEAAADELESSIGDAAGSLSFATMVSIADGVSEGFSLPGQMAEEDPKFEFRNLPLGSYSLTGTCAVGKLQYSTRMTVEVDNAGVDNLELRPLGPSTITGQLRLEGESKSKLNETLVSAGRVYRIYPGDNSESPDGKPAEDGTFSLRNLSPGIYHLNVKAPEGLYVKSITQDGRDVQESGVDLQAGGMSIALQVLLSANGGSIEGLVENGAGAHVTLIPSDPQTGRTSANVAEAGTDGHFVFPVVAPGRYQLFAWEDADDANAAIYDGAFRKPFESKAQTADVAEKQKVTAQLQSIPKVEK
jgi:hypothetical protein